MMGDTTGTTVGTSAGGELIGISAKGDDVEGLVGGVGPATVGGDAIDDDAEVKALGDATT